MKLFEVKFPPLWPVSCGLVILAENIEQCREIAKKTITHTDEIYSINEVDMSKSGVVFYENGDY